MYNIVVLYNPDSKKSLFLPSLAVIILVSRMMCRSGGTVAVAGSGGGAAGCADGCAAGVHALLPQEAPLFGQRAAS